MSVCLTDQFIQERKYLMNVSPASLVWYEQSFKRFSGALDSRADVITRISELRERGLSPLSVNVHLRAVNAYFRWLHIEHGKELVKIPKMGYSLDSGSPYILWSASAGSAKHFTIDL